MTRERRTAPVVITIRLFQGVHGQLLDDLTGIVRGMRAARAIHLMTVGLLHEAAGEPGERRLARSTGTGPARLVGEGDLAFVAEIVGQGDVAPGRD